MTEKMETKTQHRSSSSITRRKTTQLVKFSAKEERNASLKKVSTILQKAEHERSLEDQQVLCEYSEVVTDLKSRWQRRDEMKRRLEEVEEPMDVLEEKCKLLAKALAHSEHLVVYTGAGISTAARIPDYRGTNGIWTRLQQGKDIGNHDLSQAEPTFTHMALSQLYHRKLLKYVVSQNCDGLHLRSGLPRSALSELHGNMYIEVCKNCKPVREYWRLFDVTENTARYSHKTMRRCYACNHELVDTIVHFGERGTLQWPLNWSGACKNADAADTILCLGSSLKVLKRYPWLWQMNKPAKKRPNLYIVNLQWTPKDDGAQLKINGKCDLIMRKVMKYLGIEVSSYNREKDPIFSHATLLCEPELHTTTQPFMKPITVEVKLESEIDSKADTETCKEEKMNIDVKEEIGVIGEDVVVAKEEISVDLNQLDYCVKNEEPIKQEVNEVLKVENKNENYNFPIKPLSSNNTLISSEVDDGMNVLQAEQEQAYDLTVNKRSITEGNENICSLTETNCDNNSLNTHTTIKSARLSHNNGSSSINCTVNNVNSTLPKRKSHSLPAMASKNTSTLSKYNGSVFSIDSILNKSDKDVSNHSNVSRINENPIVNVVNPVGQNFQTIMAYYELANTVLQNQMLNYITSGFYPYQTSFLYPGLHSIINPVPYFNYDFECSGSKPTNELIKNYSNTIILDTIEKKEIIIEKPRTPSCSFCHEVYSSFTCCYYSQAEPVFIKQLHRFSKIKNCNKELVCVCCDYSTEEECESDNSEGKTDSKLKKKLKRNNKCDDVVTECNKIVENESASENIDETNICEDQGKKVEKEGEKIVKIQAGWFGKGYKKNRKPRKKQQYSNTR